MPPTEAYRWEATDRGPSLSERIALYEQHAAPLAVRAGAAALADGGVDAGSVTHLVTVSCTGFESPGVDHRLIDCLDLPADTQRVHVGFMGCHGAINGLRVVRGLAAAEPGAVILLVATELCSLHYAWGWDPNRLVGNALFGDGAAAVVGGASSRPIGGHEWRLAATGSRLLPDSADLMSWRIRDHGFEMNLSTELPSLIEAHLLEWIASWLAKQHLTVEQVGSWAVHPGGPKIIESVEAALGIDPSLTDVSRNVLREHGNMSSATVLFLLERLRRAEAAGPTVMIGFGPGIHAETALWG